MKMQTIVKYEVIEPMSNRRFFTYNREVALDRYYEKGAIVYEKHKTIGNPSRFVQTEQIVTMAWNDNPEFDEEED